MDPAEALERLGGVASRPALLGLTTRRALRTAVARGTIRKIGRNRYSILAPDQARRAVMALNGHASHVTAAQLHGWEVWITPARVQVVIPPKRLLPRTEVAEVRRRALAPDEATGWSTTHLATVVMCATDLPFADALAVADSALRHGDVDREELLRAVQRLRGERGARARRVAAYADGRAANPFESALRALAIEAGLAVVPQYEVVARGLTLHPDLVDPIAGVVIEADSWEFHGKEREAWERDCERYTALVVTGWRVLRFTWHDVRHRPDDVRACLRELYTELAAARGGPMNRASPCDTP